MAHLPVPRECVSWRPAPGWRRAGAWVARLRARLPLACLVCGARVPGGLCRHCRDAIRASRMSGGPRCARCDLGLPAGLECPDCRDLSPALERVVAAFDYAWPSELLIRQLKRQGRYGCAPVLAALLEERWREAAPPADRRACGMLVTAVPASRRALVRRGYNPAVEVGRALARGLSLEWRPGLLRRVREGDDQKHLGRHDRRQSVAGLYQCAADVRDREVLVVDDVMTTGSTLDAIARELERCGAARVRGAVLARTPLHAHSDASRGR